MSEEDGRFLRVMVATQRTQRALEIGSASGYSAIWIGLGLRQTGGHLTTIEYDDVRARQAAENVRKAGLADIVRVVHGDAFKEIPRLAGTFDFVFLDAWKRAEMGDFLAAIEDSPNVLTAIVTPSGEGISITYRK